jgi:hypothetical protein
MPPATESIMSTLPREKAGVGSAVANTIRQVGGALGVAILSTVTFTRVDSYVADHAAGPLVFPSALVNGFEIAFLVGAGMALVGLIATLLFIPRHVTGEVVVAEPAPEPA